MTIDQLIHLARNWRGTGDTILIDKANMEMNRLTAEAYDMHLVTCPQCGQIHSFIPESQDDEHTCTCGTSFTAHEAPDLFF